MIVLHAAFKDGRLLLWGEVPAGEGPRRGRKAAAPSATYPYDAGRRLASLTRGASLGFRLTRKTARLETLWLPARGGQAIPSSSLIAEPPASRRKAKLAPWTVTVHPLPPEATIDLLCRAMGQRTLAVGVVVGADLAFWAEALRFAGSLVARQRYLPGLIFREGGYRAVWEPVFEGRDTEQLAALAKRMPPAARALSEPEALAPPAANPLRVLKDFIGCFVDTLVRSSAPLEPWQAAGRRRRRPRFESPHDAWLYALSEPDGIVEAEPARLRELAAQVDSWRRPVQVIASSPFRLCFRLEEPENGSPRAETPPDRRYDRWYLRYLLQPHDDPSLLVPVEDALGGKRRRASVLKRYGTDVRELVLSSLGQAVGIYPEIAAGLETATPAGQSLDTSQAHEFLSAGAPVLEQSGYGVLLPSWWIPKGTKARLAARAHVKSPKMKGSGLGLDTLVRFEWKVALGEETLTPEELESLARAKAPLVRLRGQWVEIGAADIQKALAVWEKAKAGRASVRDILQMSLGAKEGPGGLELGGVEAGGWIGNMLKRLEGRAALKTLRPPKGFVGRLRPYQIRGFSWLFFLRNWGLGACLADDMGLGKTIQTLALVQHDWESGRKRPALLICPTSVINNWQKEALRFTPGLPVMIHHGPDREKGKRFKKKAARNALVVSSYALLSRDIEFLRDVAWAGVILDEAQNIKNPETRQSRAARSLEADYRIALTGTPVENNVGDLWSIMEYLNRGLLGTETRFRRTFFIPIQAGRDEEAARRLRRITGPFILRRLKTDKSIISDLPEKLEMKVYCSLTREQASLYAAVLEEMELALASSKGIQRKGLILATLSKLKQVCNHPAQFMGDLSRTEGRSGKLARLTEMLEEVLQVKDRALVFTQFAEMGALLQRHLQESFGREVLFLHGGVPRARRDRMVERFQAPGDDAPIFVLSLKAGGTGLNLTRANHVFHFDRWWNPAVENQATDRAFRIGQRRRVQVRKLICTGTLEEKIDEMIERKKEIAEQVVGTGEGWLTELNNRELREILALRTEALGE